MSLENMNLSGEKQTDGAAQESRAAQVRARRAEQEAANGANQGAAQEQRAEREAEQRAEREAEQRAEQDEWWFEHPAITQAMKVMGENSLEAHTDEWERMAAYFLKALSESKERQARYRAKISYLEKYIQESGQREQIAAYKRAQAQKGGRPRAAVDWGKYDALKKAGANQAQAAEILGVGVSTLRRLLKDRR